jgi:hypothetical protein
MALHERVWRPIGAFRYFAGTLGSQPRFLMAAMRYTSVMMEDHPEEERSVLEEYNWTNEPVSSRFALGGDGCEGPL